MGTGEGGSVTDDNRECEVPLIEQLRDIPKDYRTVRAIQWDDDGRETGHQFIPVGFMMHRAAAELESQAAEIERLKEDAERYERICSVLKGFIDHSDKTKNYSGAYYISNSSMDDLRAAIDAAKGKS
jgi:hypothetical protein